MTDPQRNDDGARELLTRAVPPPPPTDAWAGRIRARRGRRQVTAGLVALILVAVIPFGVFHLTRDTSPPVGAGSSPLFTPGAEVSGDAMILSRDGEPPVLCIGPMHDIYPPDCTGPALLGEFSWEEISFEEEGEVRWSSQAHHVQGRFEPSDGERGSLLVTEPVTPVPQDGGEELDFPQICGDPLRGADPELTGDDAQADLEAALEGLDVVDVWVSGGVDAYNIVVTGDAEEVHAALREVWGGELCVESAPDALTTEERMEVAERVAGAIPEGVGQGWDPSGPDGSINVYVLYLDAPTAAEIREAAGAVVVNVHTELTVVGADPVIVLD